MAFWQVFRKIPERFGVAHPCLQHVWLTIGQHMLVSQASVELAGLTPLFSVEINLQQFPLMSQTTRAHKLCQKFDLMCNNMYVLTLNNTGYILGCHKRLNFFHSQLPLLHMSIPSLDNLHQLNYWQLKENWNGIWASPLERHNKRDIMIALPLTRLGTRQREAGLWLLLLFAPFSHKLFILYFGMSFIGHRCKSLLSIIDCPLLKQLSMLLWETEM